VNNDKPITILCVSSYFKGSRFIETCKEEGCRTLLLTVEKLLQDPWPRGSIDEVYALPNFDDRQHVINAVTYLARTESIDRVAPLDDFDVELVAHLREHLRLPGMGETTARYFRDKLAMRERAEERGIRIPRYVHCLNYDRIRKFLDEVPAPWMFKPRAEASATGIKKLHHADEVLETVHSLGDRMSHYLIEEMIEGDVYHVDSIVSENEVVFAEAHRYRRPLFEVAHHGGVFGSVTLQRDAAETKKILGVNKDLLRELGFVRGVTHSEFIRSKKDGEFYFLETAARVGGAHIAELVETATGVNLWAEWAKIEIRQGKFGYPLPKARKDYAGVLVSLAKQEWPDVSAYNDPEIAMKLTEKKHHVGFIVRGSSQAEVEATIDRLIKRVERDFLAVLPAAERPTS
jgi:biotin carboxylase